MNEYVEPHVGRSLLLTIDVQKDFTLPEGKATIPGTKDCLDEIRTLTESYREYERPIVHVVRLYRSDGSNVDPCRRAEIEEGSTVVEPGSDGAELVEELKPTDAGRLEPEKLLKGEFQSTGKNREWIMYKPRWGAFYRTPLEKKLNALSVDTLVVCGCNFPNCPRTTIYEASERDYRVVCVPDATSGTYEKGLNELADIGVKLWDSSETLNWLTRD